MIIRAATRRQVAILTCQILTSLYIGAIGVASQVLEMKLSCCYLIPVAVLVGATLMPSAWSQSRPDLSQIPIAADEPIAPVGFPPVPSRLDLPVKPANYGSYQIDKNDPFMQSDSTGTAPKSTTTSSRKTNYPYLQPRARLGSEPRLQPMNQSPGLVGPSLDNVQGPMIEAPQPVTVDQGRVQDLSMPGDFNQNQNSNANSNSLTQRVKGQLNTAANREMRVIRANAAVRIPLIPLNLNRFIR